MKENSVRESPPISLLLVDDDEIFREVTCSALSDEGFVVHQASDGNQALLLLKKFPKIDVIFSDIRMPGLDGIGLLKAVRSFSQIPVILTTGFSDVVETQTAHSLGANGFLAKPFEMSELLGCINSTQADLDSKTTLDEEFSKVPLDDFVSGKILRYNIFVRLAENKFVKIAHEGIDLDIERIRSYKARGVKHLYLLKKDFKDYLSTSVSIMKRVSATKSIDPEKKKNFLKHTGTLLMEKVTVEELDVFALEASREFFMASSEVIFEQDDIFSALSMLNEHSDFLYAHSIGVSMYSIMIARQMNWKSAPTVFRVGLAGLLHDIGLKEIDRKVVQTPRPMLTRLERILYETHPTRSAEILSACESVPEEVIQAVAQHHEDLNGHGYPSGRKGKDISPLAHLLSVADTFCEYAVKNPDYPRGMGAVEALDKMEQFKRDSLDPEFFNALKALVKTNVK